MDRDRNSSFRILAKEIASMFNTPILLITFNRPAHTRQVLERILEVRPQDLYVFQDGARAGNENDAQKCTEVRQTVDELWDNYKSKVKEQNAPTIHRYYSNVNLGCGPGPAAAISWFFSQVERGIIIEDDAVPHLDFFPYCEELLNKYRDDNSIRAIASMNVDTQRWGDGSYYFSMMNRNLCAWATWRRAWNDFDLYLRNVSWCTLDKTLKQYGCGFYEREYWLDRLKEAQTDGQGGRSWDMQFFMSIWLHKGKGIIPNVNLSSNIGTVGEATHQMAAGNIIDNVPAQPILPLVHPSTTNIQNKADRDFHHRYFEPQEKNFMRFVAKLNKRIKRIVGHEGSWIKK